MKVDFDLNVTLSLFDGISCGQEALKKAGISTRIYLASEIEKYPKQITRKNHPLTVQLGDVTKVVADDLPHVNLLMGGSPCQGFSFAGKQLNFDDPRSALFFEFVRLLRECKPDYFLLENVMMKQEYQDVITEHLGVEPVMINSSLVSAQNRKRLYWTNIPGVGQPNDEGILLKDVLESFDGNAVKDTKRNQRHYRELNQKALCMSATMYKGAGNNGMSLVPRPCELKDFNENALCHHAATATDIKGNESIKRVYAETGKSPTVTTMGGGHREPKVLIVPEKVKVRKHEVDIPKLQALLKEHRKPMREISEALNVKKTTVEHWFRTDNCFSIPDADVWFNLKEYLNINTDEFDASITEFEIRDGRYDMADRVYNPEYKAPTVVASGVAKVLCHSFKEVRTEEAKKLRKEHREKTGKDHTPFRSKKLVPREDGKVGTLTPGLNKTHNVLIVPEATKKGYTEIEDGDCFDATFINSKTRRGRNMKDKSNCLTAANYDYMRYEHPTYRKLTPIECERLQTLPDNYTEGVSNTQRYKALGNGWTVDVIVHILQGLKQHLKVVAA